MSINLCAALRFVYLIYELPMLLLSHLTQDSSNPALLLPSILSAPKSYLAIGNLVFIITRATLFHNVQKGYSTTEMLQASPTAGQSLPSTS